MKRLLLFFYFLISVSISAQTLQKELGNLYSQKKFNQVIEKGSAFLKQKPDDALVNLLVGRSYFDQSKNKESRPFILNAIKYDNENTWIKGWGIFYLAQLEFLNGNIKVARNYFKNCITLNSTTNLTKSATGLLLLTGLDDYYKDWKTIETKNFRFRFQLNTIVENPENFAKSRQDAFDEINSFFNVKLSKKIDFMVWNSNEDAKQIGMRQLGLARPRFSVIHSRANQTRGHEITHVISYYLDNQRHKSRFINEGVSVAFDLKPGSKLAEAKEFMLKESSDFKISIKEAWDNPSAYPTWVYYSVAGEFVTRLLKEGSKEKLLELIKNQKYDYAVELYGNKVIQIISSLEKEINSK